MQKEEVKSEKMVFDDFNLEIEPRTKVGLVGYSGSGKSTLINLLMRFFDIKEGNGGIEIDGQDIRDVSQESLRQNISYIPQDPILFHRTIRENRVCPQFCVKSILLQIQLQPIFKI